MKLNLEIEPAKYYSGVHELMRLAFKGWIVKQNSPEGADLRLRVTVDENRPSPGFRAEIEDERGFRPVSVCHAPLADTPPHQWENEVRKALRVFVYYMLCAYAGHNINQYGLLTGMRPVKAAHRLLDALDDPQGLETALKKEYLVDDEKAALLAEIARTSRPYLAAPGPGVQPVSLYIGISYCPSRCTYCSFPGAVLRDYEQQMPAFLNCLFQEMAALGEYLGSRAVRIENIYIGGGTPTILNEKDLQGLFNHLQRCFPRYEGVEMSVEAGRADTLNRTKLQIMKEAGVSRLCINPQTMQDHTLNRIGRWHTAAQVEEMVAAARNIDFNTLNMDLIAGLPGEGQQDYEYNCRRLLSLRPENITVHSLAVKKGSPMAVNNGLESFPLGGGEVEKAVRYFEQALREAGYQPYYLYRQKHIRDNMENIGYALPGHICRYNVQMIEERQTIIGLGGGAASKFVNHKQELAGAFYNPKDPFFYCRDIERLVQAKVDKLGAIF